MSWMRGMLSCDFVEPGGTGFRGLLDFLVGRLLADGGDLLQRVQARQIH